MESRISFKNPYDTLLGILHDRIPIKKGKLISAIPINVKPKVLHSSDACTEDYCYCNK